IDAILGVEVNPIDALKVVLDTDFDTRKFEDHAKIGSSRIGLKGEYTAGPLTAHLQGDARIQNEKYADLLEDIGKAEADSRLKAVAAGFQVTNKTSRGEAKTPTDHAKIYYADYVPVGNPGDLSLAFRIGADYKVNDTIGVYLQIGSENILWFKGDVDLKKSGEYVAEEEAKVDPNYDAMWKYQMPGAGLYAKLGGKITFGTSSIEIFDKINRIGAGDLEKQNATDKTKYDSYSPITNQFQVDFNWVF
ncbi:MAG: hypothetical protein LBG27_08710, partial [Spirochaetaceae bacterium]|nr:hypothetical protein [Spirochaetaceae bacterium]